MFQEKQCHESGLTLMTKVFHLSMAERIEESIECRQFKSQST